LLRVGWRWGYSPKQTIARAGRLRQIKSWDNAPLFDGYELGGVDAAALGDRYQSSKRGKVAMMWVVIAYLYVVGLIGLHAMSADFSSKSRSWVVRIALVLWPLTVGWMFLADLWALARHGERQKWMTP
jgi:hypothetical protein